MYNTETIVYHFFKFLYDGCMMRGLLYFMLYVQWGPTKYFGPSTTQSNNMELLISVCNFAQKHAIKICSFVLCIACLYGPSAIFCSLNFINPS